MKILVDTDVVLDVLLDRAPFVEASKRLWATVESGAAQGLLAAHTLTTVHYLVRQSKGARVARDVVALLLQVFEVAAVDAGVLKRAVELDFADFEDAVSSAAAERAACGLIATRNTKDFKRSPVRAVDPLTAAARVTTGPGQVSESKAAYVKRSRRRRRAATSPSA